MVAHIAADLVERIRSFTVAERVGCFVVSPAIMAGSLQPPVEAAHFKGQIDSPPDE